MTYYLKYRPKTLDELDLKNVRESLKKILTSGNLPHAFLFTGPKGIGKTSAARIIAASVNCQSTSAALRGAIKINPCNNCDSCISITHGSNIDVIEMDAASHRGIDDVRLLRDAVKLSPAKSKMKVYIIDEAHMLTLEASNALLKTLEEPPAHVIFILATTNPEKLLDTVKSRAVIINFSKAEPAEIIASLQKIVKGEKLKIDSEVLDLIAARSEGSFRDASKILEQLVSEKVKLNAAEVKLFLAQVLPGTTEQLLNQIIDKKLSPALAEVDSSIKKGAVAESIIQKLLEDLRTELLAKVKHEQDRFPAVDSDNLIYLIELLTKANQEVKTAAIEELPLEIAIIKYCQDDSEEVVVNEDQQSKQPDPQPLTPASNKPQTNNPPEVKNIKKTRGTGQISAEIWNKILSQVKPLNMSVEALLRAAKPLKFDGKTLTLGVYYRFHKERLEEIRNRQILETVIEQVISFPARVVCTLTDAPEKKTVSQQSTDVVLTESKEEDVVKAAKEIFES